MKHYQTLKSKQTPHLHTGGLTSKSMETEISLEDFRLIKAFYPEFKRAEGIRSNSFIVDWNTLMLVVEKIHHLGKVNMEIYFISDEVEITGLSIFGHYESPPYINEHSNGTLLSVYKAVVEFIKWYNSQSQSK